MEKEKKNQLIIISIIIVLLLSVIGFVIYTILNNKKEQSNKVNIKLNQVYSSDYDLRLLDSMDNKYFIGTYEKNKISVIINNDGEEVYKGLEDIYYDAIYKMKDGNYLIYNNLNNKLSTYIFDGETIKEYYKIDDVNYVKPILYKNGVEKYIIGFASMINNNLYLYNLDDTGIIVIENKSLVADLSIDGVYYTYNENNLVVKENDGLMGVISKNGDVIIDYKYKNIMNTNNDSFIALNSKDKYGILDKNGKKIIGFNYKVISNFEDYYLIVNSKNKMALYDCNYDKLIDFKMDYDSLIDFDLRNTVNSIKLYKVSDNIVVLNNYLESLNGTEYEKHNMYVIKNKEIVKNIKQVGFSDKNVLYSYDKNFVISIYDNSFSVINTIKLENVKKINSVKYVKDNVVEVVYIDLNDKTNVKYFNMDGSETSFSLGDIKVMNYVYNIYMTNNGDKKELIIYNEEEVKCVSVVGDYIKILGEYIIVDNSIYKIVVM